MILTWALCLVLGADGTMPRSANMVPPTLNTFLLEQPAAATHHQGYLKQLASRPQLAESESAWWQTTARPDLRRLFSQFNEAIAGSPVAQAQFDAFYDQLSESPELRRSVENLFRTELDQAGTNPVLARAVQFLRANPDMAMRFLGNPARVRPLPAPLREAYNDFAGNPEWMDALHDAFGEVLDAPAAHQKILPWWEKLESLSSEGGERGPALNAELYRHPRELWLWHLRNMNLSRNKESRPWIRYWNRLIHRDPLLAKQYGPFVTELLREPEQLRQHLADLQDHQARDAEPWPPSRKPPKLPPLDLAHPVERMKQSVTKPTIHKPERPGRPDIDFPNRPERLQRPVFPAFPSAGGQDSSSNGSRPVFPKFPTMPEKDDEIQTAP